MRFAETELKGAFLVEMEPFADERGSFARAWCEREFADQGLTSRMVQTNVSFNKFTGTLRGMHYQVTPHEEAKLIQCVRGAIYDVIVDIRSDSETCGRWVGVELREGDHQLLYVPGGFAHGFLTLQDLTEVIYQVSEFYSPGYEGGIRHDDPHVAIGWPGDIRVISKKDESWPEFKSRRTS